MHTYTFPKIPKEAFRSRFGDAGKVRRMRPRASFPMIDTYPHGLPLGGFGAGTIGRTADGDFSVWHLVPGYHIHETVSACQFSMRQKIKREDKAYAQVLSSAQVPEKMPLSGWNWGYPKSAATHHVLYPKAWTDYEHKRFPVRVRCTQFTPILPHNYRETSYPVAVFKWDAFNPTDKVIEVSIMFTWQNMLGWVPKQTLPQSNVGVTWDRAKVAGSINTKVESGEYHGVILSAPERPGQDALNGEFCIATQQVLGTKVSVQSIFDCESSGEYMWAEFLEKGRLGNYPNPDIPAKGAALIVTFTLGPKDHLEVPMVLSWDLPKACDMVRYYRRFFGRSRGGQSFHIAKEALLHYKEWEQQIDAWQASYCSKKRPEWYKRMLFNELYYLADGGTLWEAVSGRFACLECFDYLFYETLDVRYYGAFPLAYFWPEIEKSTMRGFARTVNQEDRTQVSYNKGMDIRDKKAQGKAEADPIYYGIRKQKGACPHDLGSPFEDVFHKTNAYLWQNSNRWKDLNSKFVLQVYRAYVLDGRKDKQFLEDLWPAIIDAVDHLDKLDTDGDHLPENEGFPDQTFDNWTMKGTSAYCGGLRIASLVVASLIGEIIDDMDVAQRFRRYAKHALESYNEKLWNGTYYDFSEKNSDIMTAQLAGHWYLDLFDVRPVIEEQKVSSIFRTICRFNFRNVCQGARGAVNGRTMAGGPVRDVQGNDVWLGVNFMLASHLLLYGERRNAWDILRAMYDGIYRRGFLFRTPESWDVSDGFVASMYMRAGALWAVEYVLEKGEKARQLHPRPVRHRH